MKHSNQPFDPNTRFLETMAAMPIPLLTSIACAIFVVIRVPLNFFSKFHHRYVVFLSPKIGMFFKRHLGTKLFTKSYHFCGGALACWFHFRARTRFVW